MLACERVRGGQPVGQAAGELLDHRDVGVGEAGPLGVAGEGEDTDRALATSSGVDRTLSAARAGPATGQARGEVVPLRQLRLRVPRSWLVPVE